MSRPLMPPNKQIQNLQMRLHIVGRFAMGDRNKDDKRMSSAGTPYFLPKKYDYFMPMTTRKDSEGFYIPDEKLIKLLLDIKSDDEYGKRVFRKNGIWVTDPKITEIEVFFPYDLPELIFQSWYAYYTDRLCKCRGDGKVAERHFSGKCPTCKILIDDDFHCAKCDWVLPEGSNPEKTDDGFIIQVPCNEIQPCEFYNKRKCKMNGILTCSPSIMPSSGGVYALRTTGFYSTTALQTSIGLNWKQTRGHLAGIPFILRVIMHSVALEKTTATFPVAVLEYPGDTRELLEEAAKINALLLPSVVEQEKILLEQSSFEETPDEISETTQEFYKDNIDEESDDLDFVETKPVDAEKLNEKDNIDGEEENQSALFKQDE